MFTGKPNSSSVSCVTNNVVGEIRGALELTTEFSNMKFIVGHVQRSFVNMGTNQEWIPETV